MSIASGRGFAAIKECLPQLATWVGIVALFIGILSVEGCGTSGYVHLYSKADDDLAQSIKSNYAKSQITDVLKAELANQVSLQTHETDTIADYARSFRNLELHHVLGSDQSVAETLVNSQIGVALRQLGLKPTVLPSDLGALITASRSYRSALDQIAAAAKIIGADTSKPLTWCDPSQKLEDLYDKGKKPTDATRTVFQDYQNACQTRAAALDVIHAQLQAIELEPTVALASAGTDVGAAPFDAAARETLGQSPETLAGCMKRRDLYVIGVPPLDPDQPRIDIAHLAPSQQQAMQVLAMRQSSAEALQSTRALAVAQPAAGVYSTFQELAQHAVAANASLAPATAPGASAEDLATRSASIMAAQSEMASAEPVDPRVASLIDLEDCLAAIAPKRLTGAIRRLADDEEDLWKRRAAVDAAKASYDNAVAQLLAHGPSDSNDPSKALNDELQRLACLLLDPVDTFGASAPKPGQAATAAGSGKQPTATEAAGFNVDAETCKKLQILPKDGAWLPALAQQYVAQAAFNALNERLSQSGEGLNQLAACAPGTSKSTAGSSPPTAAAAPGGAAGSPGTQPPAPDPCMIAKAFDSIARKIMLQAQQEKDLQLAELAVKKQYYQVLLDQARKAVSRADMIIQLRDQQVLAAIDELEYLRHALGYLQLPNAPLASDACTHPAGLFICSPAWDVLATKNTDPAKQRPQIALAKSISSYLDSVTIGRIRYEVADLEIRNVSYLRAVDDSQFALAAYDALISSPLTLLANYHATGLTPSDIAAFLQVLAIGGIALK